MARPQNSAEPESSRLTVVGIGASAGGIDALKALLSAVPADSGLTWVVVMHLSPGHESALAELLQPHVELPVEQVTGPVALEPDRVYVIPPGAVLEVAGSELRLGDLERSPAERAPVDHFFRSLAGTRDGGAVAVVLTGAGSDGTLGLRAVKERDGLVVVQDPDEAEHDGMPRSALATGRVDLVLPVREIAPEIVRYIRTRPRLAGPAPLAPGVPAPGEPSPGEPAAGEPVPGMSAPAASPSPEQAALVDRVVARIRERTGRDFSGYRPSMILRRLGRRMQLLHVREPGDYLDRLEHDPAEADALVADLLITVTGFFRGRETFEALTREAIPRLFEGKGRDDALRVWSVGCATGEEPYSLAMLLLEEADRRADPPRIQIFASDLHQGSLDTARDGFYPKEIEADVGEERLRRFFRPEADGYRIRPEVREHVLFARHDLLSDPPYSHLDLVSCRNVLIYLQPDVQRAVVDRLHYALRPGGVLALDRAESHEWGDLFSPLGDEPALYRREDVPTPRIHMEPPSVERLESAARENPDATEPADGTEPADRTEPAADRRSDPGHALRLPEGTGACALSLGTRRPSAPPPHGGCRRGRRVVGARGADCGRTGYHRPAPADRAAAPRACGGSGSAAPRTRARG